MISRERFSSEKIHFRSIIEWGRYDATPHFSATDPSTLGRWPWAWRLGYGTLYLYVTHLRGAGPRRACSYSRVSIVVAVDTPSVAEGHSDTHPALQPISSSQETTADVSEGRCGAKILHGRVRFRLGLGSAFL